MDPLNKLKNIVYQFTGYDESAEVKPLGKEHINDSYKVTTATQAYVLQRINHHIFTNVAELQRNIQRVTEHIRKKLQERGASDIDRRVLTLVPTQEGALFFKDETGDYWRLMNYIEDSYSYDDINPELAYRAGIAFGDFQKMLSDLPGGPLFETIPNFHNMESRIASFV